VSNELRVEKDNNFLSKDQKFFIENKIFNNTFPFFLNNKSVVGKKTINKPSFSHVILRRPEERVGNEYYNSPDGDFYLGILKSFCKKHNIRINEVLRICINLTFNNGFNKCNIHRDHNYSHKQLIVYLNDCDKKSYTVIKNGKKEIKIKPEKYKGICFEDKPHYQYFPKNGIRVVIVFTFR